MASVSCASFFERLLQLSHQAWLQPILLQGFVTSAGGGSETLIQASRTALLNYTSRLPLNRLETFCYCFVDILRSHLDDDRVLTPTMEVIAFLFEAGATIALENGDFAYSFLLHGLRNSLTFVEMETIIQSRRQSPLQIDQDPED